jgi:hypothetical protein
MNCSLGILALGILATSLSGAVTLQVDANAGHKAISPAIYGKNHGISDKPAEPSADSMITLYKDVGVKMLRLGGGNNQTKYNWRAKLTSHPDWYNNVYAHDWDYSAQEVQTRLPGVQGLFSLQLIGQAAATDTNNWGDWAWGQAHPKNYPSTAWDLAGGGTFTYGTTYTMGTEGNPNLYLKDWPADSSVGILDSWFKAGGVGLDSNLFRYWNMDNEPEIWAGTHNDIIKDTTAQAFETYFAKYVAVAKAARAKWPGIQLVGPVTANEWQWWTFNGHSWKIGTTKVSATEYFIYRLGLEEKASGVKLIDVYDIHFYPGYEDASKLQNYLDLHRVYFDTTYLWPSSNGIHTIDGKWGIPVANYVFLRINRWMEEYLGTGRGRLAMSEYGSTKANGNASVQAVAYASTLGTWADNGFEIYTPWDWYDGWYEVMHLYTTYAKPTRIQSTSSSDSIVSAYSSINVAGDSLTVILVNRHQTSTQSATVNLANYTTSATHAATFQLSNLSGETFKSKTQNALVAGAVAITNKSVSMNLPKLSVTAVVFSLQGSSGIVTTPKRQTLFSTRVAGHTLHIDLEGSWAHREVHLLNLQGEMIRTVKISEGSMHQEIPLTGISLGRYFVQIPGAGMRSILFTGK